MKKKLIYIILPVSNVVTSMVLPVPLRPMSLLVNTLISYVVSGISPDKVKTVLSIPTISSFESSLSPCFFPNSRMYVPLKPIFPEFHISFTEFAVSSEDMRFFGGFGNAVNKLQIKIIIIHMLCQFQQ